MEYGGGDCFCAVPACGGGCEDCAQVVPVLPVGAFGEGDGAVGSIVEVEGGVDPAKSRNYLKKAGELYLDMLEAHRNSRFNSAVISAIHCGISSSDAYTVYTGGVRSASKDHGDAIRLLSATGAGGRRLSEHLRHQTVS